jgi:hypothetical protein
LLAQLANTVLAIGRQRHAGVLECIECFALKAAIDLVVGHRLLQPGVDVRVLEKARRPRIVIALAGL